MDVTKQVAKAQRFRTLGSLVALLVFAFLLRTWGITWGLPNAGRYYPYHPDETVLLDALCNVNPLWLDFTPHFYNYGSCYILMTRWVYDLTAPILGWGNVPRFDLPFEQWVADFSQLLLVGRLVAVVLGVGTVLATFALGQKLFNTRTGWLAAALLTIAPLPVLLGHYLAVDVPSTFFVSMALLFASCALNRADTKQAAKWMVGAAIMGGLATGTKYNTFPSLFPLLLPMWQLWRRGSSSRQWALGAGIAATLAATGAFLISTPGAVLENRLFLADVLYELNQNREGQGLIFKATSPALLHHLGVTFPVALEWPLYLLTLTGIGWSIRRRTSQDVFLWLFLLSFFLPLLPAERKFVRYVTPMIPALLLLAARAADEGLSGGRKNLWASGLVACGVLTIASTSAHLGVLSGTDARDQAAGYLRDHAQKSQIVALASDAFSYTPPIHPTAGAVKRGQRYGGPPIWDLEFAMGGERQDLTQLAQFKVLAPRSLPSPAGSLTLEQLETHKPDWLVISDYEYEDPERMRRADPSYQDGCLKLLNELDRSYRIEKEFRPRPKFAGFTWWRVGIPPHDWRYYMPTLRIYRRR